MEYDFVNKVTEIDLETRLNQLKKSMGTSFKYGNIFKCNAEADWIVEVTTSLTISLNSLEAMNNIMKAFNIIQVWTSGGKDKKLMERHLIIDFNLFTKNTLKMIKPTDLYMSKEDFDKIILDAEVEFMKQRASYAPKDRQKYVQFWVDVSPADIPKNYIDDLEDSYFNAGWDNVQVEFVNDRTTSLMVLLSQDH